MSARNLDLRIDEPEYFPELTPETISAAERSVVLSRTLELRITEPPYQSAIPADEPLPS